jgi:hypothetical protein
MRSPTKMRSMLAGTTAALGILWVAVPGAKAQQQAAPATADREALIRSALSAVPPTLRNTVKVMDFDGNVLRDGSLASLACRPRPPSLAPCAWTRAGWGGWTLSQSASLSRGPGSASAI